MILMNKLEKIFDKNQYIKDRGIKSYQENKEWVDLCNGRWVDELEQEGFKILLQWIALKEHKKKGEIDERENNIN